MVVYVCPRCHYTTTYKTHMVNHYNRKKICDTRYSRISIKDCKEQLSIKKKKLIIDKDSFEQMRGEIKELRDRLEQQQHTTNTSIGNHNKFNSDNITNNNTINININDFKNTNYVIALEDLKQSIKQSLLKNDGRNMNIECENLVELVHCNPDYPENQNILITDRTRGEAKIKQGDRFVSTRMEDAIDETAQNIVNLLKDNHLFNRYIQFHENKDDDALKEDKKAIERTLYNNRATIKETAKTNNIKIN